MIQRATVTSTSPLKVRTDSSAVPLSARVMPRGDSYSPAQGARVLVAVVDGRLYVLGGA